MQVTALHVYPVKSMRGLPVLQARVQPQGFCGDRQWLVTDTAGRFITAREREELLLWQAAPSEGGLRLTAPDGQTQLIRASDYEAPVQVTVWRDDFRACGGPAHTDAWLSHQLGTSCRLVYLGEQPQRRLAVSDQPLSFADGAPYLLTTTHSLAALNAQLPQPVTMARFRPNIVIDGLAPYAEDDWRVLRIGTTVFTNFKPCARCKIVNLDPTTAALSPAKEPLKTLARTHPLAHGAGFGVNLYAHAAGDIRIGDPVELLE